MIKKRKIIRNNIWFKRIRYIKLKSGEYLCGAVNCEIDNMFQSGNSICRTCSDIEDETPSEHWGVILDIALTYIFQQKSDDSKKICI